MKMKLNRLFFLLLIIFISANLSATYASDTRGKVFNGTDVLKARNFDQLQGKNVALVTNHTGTDRDLNRDIDLLDAAKNVRLVKIFSPEHGIRGNLDGSVENDFDAVTNIPIVSLYGKHKKPTAADLIDVDLLVFDIQDIGTRYYTYIATMAYIMQAAQKHDKEVIILDRPNPVGGVKVEGTIPPDSLSHKFTSIYPIATRHGMTIGELAQMFNREFGIGCRLTIVPMRGWRRSMTFEETGIPWVHPSPNMKTLTGALLYSGLGWLEATNISMGRGTEIPFEILGAPWIEGRKLANKMNDYALPGIRFVPWSFTPGRPNFKYYNERCEGVKVVVYDPTALDGYLTGLYLAKTIWELYPQQYQFSAGFKILLGCAETENWLKTGVSPTEIKAQKTAALEAFKKRRMKYLLYE